MLILQDKKVTESKETVTLDVVAFEELTDDEQRDRLHLERQVERSFSVAGQALRELRDRRLYRSTHPNFESYCRDRFGYNRSRSYQLIDAAIVMDVFEKCPQIVDIFPNRESQVRPLTKLDPPQQVEAWNQAVEEANAKVPSARIVSSIVDRIRERSPVPNPWNVGDVCSLIVKDNPDLRGKGGCWAIVTEVHQFSCTVKTWNGECLARIENLKELLLSPAQKLEVRQLGERLNRLSQVPELDRGAYPILESLGKQLFLTPLEEKLVNLLEDEYQML